MAFVRTLERRVQPDKFKGSEKDESVPNPEQVSDGLVAHDHEVDPEGHEHQFLINLSGRDKTNHNNKGEEYEPQGHHQQQSVHSVGASDQSVGGSESSISRSPSPRAAISSISFGALASAQASLGRKRKWGIDDVGGMHERERPQSPFREADERRAGRKKTHPAGDSRGSKHAPAELSSKKVVSRKRQVINVPKLQARDPRFSTLTGKLDTNRVEQNYSFLNDYRASEITDLKQEIRTTKDASAKEELKRNLRSMEDREKARKRVEEEKAILRDHKNAEIDKIKHGKKPFFLKKGEIKKQALVRRFESMGEKKAEKVMEKRRKKKASRERLAMPSSRRKVS